MWLHLYTQNYGAMWYKYIKLNSRWLCICKGMQTFLFRRLIIFMRIPPCNTITTISLERIISTMLGVFFLMWPSHFENCGYLQKVTDSATLALFMKLFKICWIWVSSDLLPHWVHLLNPMSSCQWTWGDMSLEDLKPIKQKDYAKVY